LIEEVRKAVRALNNVIDKNNYSTEKGLKGGLEQRAIANWNSRIGGRILSNGLFFTSDEAKTLNKNIFEAIYFAAITESNDLCKKGIRKPYEFFKGSPMSKGIFQFDMWGS
jgi:ribonucleotide reductase alpha subunit